MGQSNDAELSWGFCIPGDRIAALIRCLRKHDPANSKPESETEQEEQPEEDEDEWIDPEELDAYMCQVLEDKKFGGAFEFRVVSEAEYGGGGAVEEIIIFHAESITYAERPGRESYGTTVMGLGPELLYDAQQAQELVRQLEVDLHLAEIGMELPVKEQWLLAITIA
ncbi:hypothetical protein BOTBODRAFT_53592 [Botryobasidium botryosum FD-172 SS1]|uniref:Uncharacterized protein n=1 Tax=Botryobasidium botryosum (strain FD-172 SS1) TaxID=930990 RepID=A0A067MMF4_BOTB1|nr:hypothetical protein BOTBODRAFT_53592 [Botryobasidium botryosum FD-172 SS1]